MDYFDELFELQDQTDKTKKVQEDQEPKPESAADIRQRECKHPELYHSICLKCDKYLSNLEIKGRGLATEQQYREYALLGRGANLLIRQDCAHEYIEKSVQELYKNRKLVLVLDLDNTLIHSHFLGEDRRIK